jgi:hypothetical protein
MYDSNRLNSFGSWSICWLITLPLIMALSCFFIPAMWKTDSISVDVAVGITHIGEPVVVQLKEDINSLGYLKSSLSVDAYNISRYVCLLEANQQDGLTLSSSPYDGQMLVTGHLEHNQTTMIELVEYKIPFEAFRSSGGVNCSPQAQWDVRRDDHRLYMPLEMAGLDMPGVLDASPRWVTFNITTTGPHVAWISSSTSSEEPFYFVRLTLTSQNAVYALVSAFTTLMLVFVSLLVTGYVVATILRDRRRSDDSAAQESSSSSFACSNHHHLSGLESLSTTRLSAEQGTSLLLLVLLAAWQNPIRSACIIAHYLSIYALSNTALLCSGICGALSSFGELHLCISRFGSPC